jgi:hypothetical protein
MRSTLRRSPGVVQTRWLELRAGWAGCSRDRSTVPMQGIARSRSPPPRLMQKNLTTPAPTLTAREATYGRRLGQLCIPWLPAVLIMVGAGLVSASHIAGDSWLSLVGGREIVRHGLPSQDTLSSLGQGRTWIDEEWLSQLVFYGAYTVGGLGAVMVVGRIAVTIGELVALGVAGARRSSALSVGLALLMAFALLGSRSEVRAQLLAEPLFTLLLWLLVDEVRRPTRRALWAVPLILLVWANLHGSVLLGGALVLLAMAFVAAQRSRRRSAPDLRRIGWLVLVAFLAPFATPYGWRIVDYYRSTLDNHTLARFLTEWSHSTPSTAPLECGAVAAVVVLVALNWRRARLFEAAVLLALAAATLLAQRNAVWLALAIAALLPPLLDRIVPARLQLREIRGAAVLFVLAAAFGVVMLARMAGTDDAALATAFPRSASAISAAAARDPRADVLATPALGDWLLFQDPALAGRIVADGRFEVISSRDFVRLVDVLGGRRSLAATFPRARILALSPGTGLAQRAIRSPGARTVEDDGDLVLITLPERPRSATGR